MRPEKRGWSAKDIHELFDEIVEELSLIGECQPAERMVEISAETEVVIRMSDRIIERYTAAHIKYHSESIAEDKLPEIK